ncbi:MAG: hypothetical protein ACT6R7_02510 [Brevundimonas aurantiaca]|jgi:hypothetical protein|uniref:hypothetical protein n=1 Tax=Brevundimonas aurantiaca TaxID=74316 RepID=UPI00403418DF
MKVLSVLLGSWPVVLMLLTNAINLLFVMVVNRLPQPWRGAGEIAVGLVQGFLGLLLAQHLILGLGQSGYPTFDAVLLAITVLSVGFGFWVLRVLQRAAYGALEIVFAVGAALTIGFNPHANPLINTIAAGTVVYVVVRGLDNLEQGLPGGLYARLPMRWRAPGNAPPPPPASRSTP